MAVVNVEIDQQIATLTIQNGKVNAISHEVLDELNNALDQAEAAKATVIITGQAGMFSGGFDLTVMHAGLKSAVDLVSKGSRLSRRLLSFPTPIIAACSGHAIAKGAFLLLSSDYRIGCKGDFKIGLNEVAIGMTMHHAGIEMARGRIPSHHISDAVLNAGIYSPEQAITVGYLDEIVSPEQLLNAAKAKAEKLNKLDMTAHLGTKLRIREHLLTAIDKAMEKDLAVLDK